jgi:outer membrane protein OmpA-like peptidoglycan-associated protein
LNVTVNPTNKVYDGTTDAAVTYTDNRISGDSLTVTGDAAFSSKTAVNGKTVTSSNLAISGLDAANYVLPSVSINSVQTANITPRVLTITGTFGVANRQYDATTDATAQVTPPVSPGLSDVQLSDDVTLSGAPTFTFAQATVGTGIGITTTGYSLSGADASNYTLTLPTFTANITQRPLTIGGSLITPSSRVYNQTSSATISTPSALTLVNVPAADSGDSLKIALASPVAAFTDKNVGTAKTVALTSASLSGSRSANYTLTLAGSPTATANITARTLNVTITATNKVYDGAETASVSYADDRISGDQLTVSGTSTFSSKTVGTAKTVTSSGISISGTDAANYTHNTTATTTANITARTLNITITATNKVYDGADTASVSYADNRVSGDIFTVSGTPTFSSKTVGNAKTVTANGIAISGTDAANYTHNTTATTNANITPRTLTVTITASNKTYDGTTNVTVSYLDNRVSGDLFTVTGTSAFSSKSVDNSKTVTASSISISGTDAANYTHNTTATTTANITPRTLTVTITATNKTYDGTTNATVSYADDRISGDQLTVSGTPTFGSKTVGNAKTIASSGISISGIDAANYTHNTSATTTANITARALTVTITATNKVYDGTTSASVVYSDNRVSGDQLTASGTPVFSDKNVAASKLITASSIAISGTDAANYTHNTTATTTANITRRPLSVVAIANDKTYDATNVATVSYTDNRLDGDVFTISSTALFDDAELGRDKPVSITNITLAGTDASNYQPNSSATSTGDITVREISASIPAVVSNAPLSDSTPTVHIGDLVPSVDTTVTFTRPGFTSVVCSMIPQHVTDTCTATALTDGVWTYRARQLVAGLMVAASEQLTITIDTVAPSVTKAATFVASSDTGASATDGITSDATPTVSIADASATDRVVVTATFSGQTIQCSFTATASDRTCTLPALTDGAWSITAVITDSANNVSSPTPPMVATIDTVIPAASAAPFNAQDNGATTSLDATPRISITGVNAGDIATVNGLSSKAEKASCSFTASSTTSFCEMSTMPSGTWSLTATVTDLAGNTSPPSPPTQLIISAGLAPVTVARSAVVPSPSVNRRENVVAVKFGAPAAIAGVQSVSFIVLDGSGKVVRRATIKVKPTDTGARIVVPASVKGARVRVITTNQCGVSDGAPRSFNVRPGKTSISVDPRTNAPSLAGQLVLPQIDFGPSEITLDATDRAQLDKVAKDMDGKCGTLLVSGFSRFNNTDSRRYLQNLADFRAKAVADYLSSKGLTMWISYKGFVIRSNDNAASANRRVALYWTPA